MAGVVDLLELHFMAKGMFMYTILNDEHANPELPHIGSMTITLVKRSTGRKSCVYLMFQFNLCECHNSSTPMLADHFFIELNLCNYHFGIVLGHLSPVTVKGNFTAIE